MKWDSRNKYSRYFYEWSVRREKGWIAVVTLKNMKNSGKWQAVDRYGRRMKTGTPINSSWWTIQRLLEQLWWRIETLGRHYELFNVSQVDLALYLPLYRVRCRTIRNACLISSLDLADTKCHNSRRALLTR